MDGILGTQAPEEMMRRTVAVLGGIEEAHAPVRRTIEKPRQGPIGGGGGLGYRGGVERTAVLLYVALKFLAYAAWLQVGYTVFHRDLGVTPHPILFGVVRLVVGLVVGIGIWIGSTAVYVLLAERTGIASELATYVLVYVPVRVAEWALVGLLAYGRLASGWLAGGVLVSILADVPMVWALEWHLPLGRFLC